MRLKKWSRGKRLKMRYTRRQEVEGDVDEQVRL